jgi:hypothetical protein
LRKSQSGKVPGQSGEVPEFARTEDKILDSCSKLISRNQNFEKINDLALRRDAARTGMKAISLFFGATTFSIMTFSITTLSIMGLFATLSINET